MSVKRGMCVNSTHDHEHWIFYLDSWRVPKMHYMRDNDGTWVGQIPTDVLLLEKVRNDYKFIISMKPHRTRASNNTGRSSHIGVTNGSSHIETYDVVIDCIEQKCNATYIRNTVGEWSDAWIGQPAHPYEQQQLEAARSQYIINTLSM